MTYRRCLMLLVDGARADDFESLLARGDLPHIQRYILEPGAYRRSVTAFPSTTGPAYLPFVTGCLPATCNVPGIRWFDKQRHRDGSKRGARSYVGIETYRINRDMSRHIDTLFSILPRSYNVFNAVSRGVRVRRDLTWLSRAYYWYYAHLTDRWGFVDHAASKKLREIVAKDFQFGFVVFPGVDEYSHLKTPSHIRVREAYQVVDKAVGLAAQRLQRLGRLEETMWWIVSDHGLTATHTHFCVNDYMASRDHRPLSFPWIYNRGCRVVNMMSGNGMTHLYFRHERGWAEPVAYEYLQATSPGVVDGLLEEPAVDLIAARSEGHRIIVKTADGEATLERMGGTIRYSKKKGDPLGVLGAADISAQWSAEDILQRSMDTRYPDGMYQLTQLFDSERTGDVVVSATPGYDLRRDHESPEHFGSHGSLHRDHMHVPIACSAPLTEGPMRTIDVFPSTLQHMAMAQTTPIDGISRAGC